MSPDLTPDGHKRGPRRLYMREFMRQKRASNVANNLPFRGVDGEGGGEKGVRHPGYHAYFLLRAGRDVVLPANGDVRIKTSEALEVLSRLDPKACYVAYFFNYDVTKILEDVSFDKLGRLLDRQSRTPDGRGRPYPVSYGPYDFDYLPGKEFKVRKRSGDEQSPWIVVNDVGSFFQCSFVKALEQWSIGTDEQRAIIAAGKLQRGDFDTDQLEEIDRYNEMEIVLLEQLMEKFRAACYNVGLYPANWQGPGQLAKALLAKYNVPKSKRIPMFQDPEYQGLLDYGRNAYYGGRPELMAIGPVDRPCWQYDINSAYPAAMREVPCLMHGGWEHVNAKRYSELMAGKSGLPDCSILYGSYRDRERGKVSTGWYGLPFRTETGSIHYPGSGRGWYWDFEVRASIHQQFHVEDAWVYTRQCDCKPLGWIEEVYQQRLALGKDGPGMVLKLAMNSVYGVCVQSVGSPEYSNPIWASFITAWCRTKIQTFIHGSISCSAGRCGEDILMVATDSVATWRERGDVEDSKVLGGWSVEAHPRGLFLVQPGVYYGSSGKHAKTRGVPLAIMEEKEQEFRAAFREMVESQRLDLGDVRVPQHMFVGIRYALQRRNQKLLGQWIELGEDDGSGKVGKAIRFDWTTKRLDYPIVPPGPHHSYIRTFPKPGSPDECTVPYSKDIGGLVARGEQRLALADQPDWAPMIEPGEMG